MSEAAASSWSSESGLRTQELSALIVYFSVGESSIDVDNIAKPILDALVGVVYADDAVLTQVILRKTVLLEGLVIEDSSAVLAGALAATYSDFVYVRIYKGPDHKRLPI